MKQYLYKTLAFVLLGVILNIFLCVNVFAQQLPKTPKNSDDYIRIIKYYRYLNPDSALIFVKQGLKIAEQQGDDLGKAALLNQHGMIDDNATRYRESREKYLQAEAIYREKGDDVGLAATIVRLGVVEKRKGNYDKALAYFMEALNISEKNNHKLGMLEGRVVFAEAYYSLGEYQNALSNLRIAEEIDRQIPLSNLSLNMYINFGYVYTKLGEYEKAISYVNNGLSKSNRVEFNGLKISLLRQLATTYFMQGKTKDAIKVYRQALSFTREIKNVLREQTTLVELSEVYAKQQPDSALFFLLQSLKIAEKHKMYRQQITALDKIGDLYKTKGNLAKALFYIEKRSELAEKVFYTDMMKQVSSLESAYELEKSKAQLNELTLKNREQQIFYNIVLFVAIAIFMVLVITLVYYFRSKHLNKLLKKANLELEESNEIKDKFFSIIAHDIRSPLVSTISILRLINDKELDEKTQHQMVNKLMLHCDSSLEILDKLLKWGQMQIKGVRLNISEFDPLPNILRNLALFQEAAAQKNIAINVDIPGDIMLQADADHFDFVIRNLTANAIKFTNSNGEVSLKAEAVDRNKIKFEVRDNGVGISQARIKKLFELSAMGTKGTKSEEGTSLGLIICREFVAANEGEMEVSSEVGQGTIFSFTMKGFLKKIA
ncbi:MAG: tetratricopeptide repeat-containing sensor histidine kinase [Pedobacter sp.]|uniref:tetratricopeptide repeat-containing sensor histidine kinase n=1 Tax=Pedobacter sp. TaxID=1411316 RepID=UPI0028068D49|nr:tetratricopeptide repeat-containing sensor histidine kinase [Pedobacter sp.]MDQ8005769.1 tetratricopeptide repeat-containing sensor histidine kinase [Pedobacter sp.]